MNLQEQISRMKSMMGLITERLSDIQGTPLYHKTSTNRGLDIISSDSLRGTLPSEDYLKYDKRLADTKKQRAISLTRDKGWTPNHTIGMGLDSPIEDKDITFVLDKDKLKTKYRVEPFNYDAIDPRHEYKDKSKELEERVLTDEIYPLHKYLIDIIYTGNNPNVQDIIKNYLQGSKQAEGLNESALTHFKRKLDLLPDYIKSTYTWLNPRAFDSFEKFLDTVIQSTARDFISREYETYRRLDHYKIEVEIYYFLRTYIIENFLDEIKEYFDTHP